MIGSLSFKGTIIDSNRYEKTTTDAEDKAILSGVEEALNSATSRIKPTDNLNQFNEFNVNGKIIGFHNWNDLDMTLSVTDPMTHSKFKLFSSSGETNFNYPLLCEQMKRVTNICIKILNKLKSEYDESKKETKKETDSSSFIP